MSLLVASGFAKSLHVMNAGGTTLLAPSTYRFLQSMGPPITAWAASSREGDGNILRKSSCYIGYCHVLTTPPFLSP